MGLFTKLWVYTSKAKSPQVPAVVNDHQKVVGNRSTLLGSILSCVSRFFYIGDKTVWALSPEAPSQHWHHPAGKNKDGLIPGFLERQAQSDVICTSPILCMTYCSIFVGSCVPFSLNLNSVPGSVFIENQQNQHRHHQVNIQKLRRWLIVLGWAVQGIGWHITYPLDILFLWLKLLSVHFKEWMMSLGHTFLYTLKQKIL